MTTRRIELLREMQNCGTLQSIDLTENEERYSAILGTKRVSKFVSSSFMSNRPALRGDVALFDWKQPPTQNDNKASKQGSTFCLMFSHLELAQDHIL